MPKFKYHENDRIGPYNILFLKRKYKKGNNWYGDFLCPSCGKIFETRLSYVVDGQTRSCGCVGGVKDWTGHRFGRLIALRPLDKRKSNHVVWECQCDCGNIVEVSTGHLLDGGVTSCGCIYSPNLVGRRYGKLVVIEKTSETTSNGYLWKCHCDCGKYTYASTNSLNQGYKKSCGCLYSWGEWYIKNFLKEKGVSFIQQYSFSDCVNPITTKRLRFDFFLPDYNICIEYNGKQHYLLEGEGYYTSKALQEMRFRDNLKKEYCQKNKLVLLEIPYWYNDNIENFLIESLARKGVVLSA